MSCCRQLLYTKEEKAIIEDVAELFWAVLDKEFKRLWAARDPRLAAIHFLADGNGCGRPKRKVEGMIAYIRSKLKHKRKGAPKAKGAAKKKKQ